MKKESLCSVCDRKALITRPSLGSRCRECLWKIIIQRAKRELFSAGKIKADQTIIVLDDGGPVAEVTLQAIRELTSDVPCEIIVVSELDELPAHDRLVIPWTADDQAEKVLKIVCEGADDGPSDEIMLLKRVRREDVLLFSDRDPEKGLSFASRLLQEMEDRQPGTIPSLAKVFRN